MLETMLSDEKIFFGGKARIYFRSVKPEDGLLVSSWRNTPLARSSFYSNEVVTPESHSLWLAQKSPYDQVWMACLYDGIAPVGMTGLHIDPVAYTGEYGRTWVSPDFRGRGYAVEIEYTLMAVAFELFELKSLWLEAFTSNVSILSLHDKTGWTRSGINTKGRLYPNRPVQFMTINRLRWARVRQDFYQMIGRAPREWYP